MYLPKSKGGIGFMKMTYFNEVLLVKHGWRLINHMDSLVAKVMKGRYFPRINFLHTNIGYNWNYIWQSIYNARRVLKKGGIWKIVYGA